jgi:two-component system chemotaxis sensor kinase CheA
MSIDLSQFHQLFFDESFEGLNILEQGLLKLSPDNVDAELINNIFRAAHSIKGASATFKFDQIAEFTHLIETLLDEIRNQTRPVTDDIVDVLLTSVDRLREMLTLFQKGNSVDAKVYHEVAVALRDILSENVYQEPLAKQSNAVHLKSESKSKLDVNNGIWLIRFIPDPQILRTGNEPIRMFRELMSMGELVVFVDVDRVPLISEIDEEECYCSWTLLFYSDSTKEPIEEVFEWVEDQCQLIIEQISDQEAEQLKHSLNGEHVSEVSQNDRSSNIDAAPYTVSDGAHKIELNQDISTTSNQEYVNSSISSSVRVGIDKIDKLINLVGELVITQSMLSTLGKDFSINKLELLDEGFKQLEKNTRELQETVIQIRMLPLSFVFNRFPRMIRDLGHQLNKKIDLKIEGESVELDKTLLEKIGDPLVHLVRNSIDHGIESPKVRAAEGKSEVGTIVLRAYHQNSSIFIEIEDDGAGIDMDKVLQKAVEKGLVKESGFLPEEKIHHLIFEPGFSTSEVVSDVSGRGVGLDVVKKNISALGGTVKVTSKRGVGSKFTIQLPLTLAIADGQLVRIGTEVFVIPITSIIESTQINTKEVVSVAGQMEVFKLRDNHVPIVRLYQEFNIKAKFVDFENSIIVVTEGLGTSIGLMVDELLGQQQVVIKSIEANFLPIEGISGATILGNGQVALILDIAGLVKRLKRKQNQSKVNAA